MIRDGIEGLADSTHDICVVGAGPVGIALALELSRQGRRVLVLESGGDGPDDAAQKLSDAEIADPARHDSMSIAVSRQLGGTSNLWGGRCLPYDAIDFEHRPVHGDARWPIGLADLTPHFSRAIQYACAGADVFQTDELTTTGDDARFSTAHLERWSTNKRAQIAHRDALTRDPAIDVRLGATAVAFRWIDDRVSRVIVAACDGQGTNVAVDAVVLATGGLESTRLLLSEQRKTPARFGGADGALGRYYMGHVIGEIADVVLTSEAVDRAFDFTIDLHGSYVRRRITPSPTFLRENNLLNCAFWPVVPPVANPAHRDGFLSTIALGLSVDALGRRIVPEAIRRRHIPDEMKRGPHLQNVLRDLPSAIIEVPKLFWRRYGAKVPAPAFFKHNAAHRYGLSYHAEQAPRRDSRVWLGERQDAFGLPRLTIDLRFSRDDAASVVTLHDALTQWLPTAGIGTLVSRMSEDERIDAVLRQASHGTHQIGTARMAASARDGVVDGDLRAFGCSNLYVASSAVLPTSGQANPTLTVMALAMRLADRLAKPQHITSSSSSASEQRNAAAA